MGQRADTKMFTVGVTTPVEILPLRAEREVTIIYNTTGNLMFKFGAGVSSTNFTGVVPATDMTPPLYRYTGPITALKQGSGTTVVMVTEVW